MGKHAETWTCDYWRSCCCSHGADGHCWGCGMPQAEHANGEHKKPSAEPAPAKVGEP